jgi:hypothetical protein
VGRFFFQSPEVCKNSGVSPSFWQPGTYRDSRLFPRSLHLKRFAV